MEEIKDTKREIGFVIGEIDNALHGYQRELTGLKEKINFLKELHERLEDQEEELANKF